MPLSGYNFTERVRKVLAMAREEAARLHHEYVGTEHILLALVREGEGVASTVLQNLSVDLDEVQQKVEDIVKKGRASHTTGPDLPYTSRAKKVLELAMSEARELSHSYVGTEHLLLGVIAEDKGIGSQVLQSQGVTLERARAETVRLLGPELAPATSPDAGRVHPVASGYARSRSPYGVAIVEDFTGRARDALRGAYDEANSRHYDAVELSHLLLALASREDGMAAVLLDQAMGSRKRLVEAMVERLPDKEKPADRRPVQLSPDTQQVLDNALVEASKDGHRRAGTQHLLLAALDELPIALAAACTSKQPAAAPVPRIACDNDNAGITVPAGFCALVFADSIQKGRYITVADNGDVYVSIEGTARRSDHGLPRQGSCRTARVSGDRERTPRGGHVAGGVDGRGRAPLVGSP